MTVVNTLALANQEPEAKLEMVKICTSAPENRLFLKFLSRGSASTTNKEIRNMIQQIGYYSVLVADWSNYEKYFIFFSASYQMKSQPDSAHSASPIFKIQLVGNRIFCPNAFWGEERNWLLQNKQPVDIVEILLGWLHDWGINTSVESSTPISYLSEIDFEARKLRLPSYAKPKSIKNEDYQKFRELYTQKMADWISLIEKAKDDLECLKNFKI